MDGAELFTKNRPSVVRQEKLCFGRQVHQVMSAPLSYELQRLQGMGQGGSDKLGNRHLCSEHAARSAHVVRTLLLDTPHRRGYHFLDDLDCRSPRWWVGPHLTLKLL